METELPHREGADGSVTYPPLPSAKRSLESPEPGKKPREAQHGICCSLVILLLKTCCHATLDAILSDETKNDSDAESCRTVTARMEAQGIVDTIWRLERKSDAVAPLGISKTENGPTTTFMTVRNH